MENKVMLITYADSMGENIKELHELLNTYYKDAVGGIHILPFYPSSADRGFAPLRYDVVDEKFGTYDDIASLAEDYSLMFDFMLNHISAHSPYYLDFLKNNYLSIYNDFFIRYSDFWENGAPTRAQLEKIYKRKPKAPYVEAEFADGRKDKIWCTFSEEQIDLNLENKATMKFAQSTVEDLCKKGASAIRLDAFAYATKKENTNCFFVEPEVWKLLKKIEKATKKYDAILLPEIHEHYSLHLKLARQHFWTYDFALPVLTLHALYNHDGQYLKHWLDICPRKQFTTLDTHDGIGIVDVKDLLPDEEIEKVREQMYQYGANVKKIYNTEAYNNLDIYQINTTYFSALGHHAKAYLLARAIQFFAPGIPQVYYVGLLAGKNDVALMEETKNGRDINRHYYTANEVRRLQNDPTVCALRELMVLRNTHPAFSLDADIDVYSEGSTFRITRTYKEHKIVLNANLKSYHYSIIQN